MAQPVVVGRLLALSAAVVAPTVFGAAGLAAAPSRTPVQAAPARPPEKIYRSTCGYCHGAHVGPIIRGRSLPPEFVSQMVRTGPNAMPAFRPTEISDAELTSLAQWINKSKADPKEFGN